MKIKTQKILCIIFMFLPLALSAIALIYMPEQIPAHYGANGQVDRWGSKYENLILPMLVILFGLFMIVISKFSSDDEPSGKNNQKIILTTTLLLMILLNAMNLFFLYTSFTSVTDLNNAPVDLYSLIFILFGIGFIIIGNIMPKARMNSFVGMRTPWSIKNEDTWRKSQRFGGITLIISGLLMIVGCIFFFKGTAALIFSMILISGMAAVDTVYSYMISQKY